MKELFEVKLIYTAMVLADPEEVVEDIASNLADEIVSDYHGSPVVEVGSEFRTRKELEAHSWTYNGGWDDMDIPHGGDGNTRIGTILDEIEAADLAKAGAQEGRCLLTTDMFEEPKPEAPAEPERPPNFRLIVARRHAKAGDDWHWASMRYVGDGEGAGAIVEGGVPNIAPDGSRRWTGVVLDEVIVTEEQAHAAALAYEAETGKCMECAGSGLMHTGWNHKTGNAYAPCNRCNATGKAPSL